MPNMSYCRFQNTLSDLRECYGVMEESENLSKDEAKAKENLIKLCKKIADENSSDDE